MSKSWTDESIWSRCLGKGLEFQHILKMYFQKSKKRWKVCTCKLTQVFKKWFVCHSETIWISSFFSLSLSLFQTYKRKILDIKNYSISNTFVGWLFWYSIMLLIMNLLSGCSQVVMPTSGLFSSDHLDNRASSSPIPSYSRSTAQSRLGTWHIPGFWLAGTAGLYGLAK